MREYNLLYTISLIMLDWKLNLPKVCNIYFFSLGNTDTHRTDILCNGAGDIWGRKLELLCHPVL